MQANPSDNPRVFISHSVRDSEWARAFAEALQQRGLSVWLDEFNVSLGDSLVDALEKALRDSDIVVTLVDKDTVHAPNLFFELGAAIGMGKRVVAVVPKDLNLEKLPIELRRRRYLMRDTPQETAEELSQALRAA